MKELNIAIIVVDLTMIVYSIIIIVGVCIPISSTASQETEEEVNVKIGIVWFAPFCSLNKGIYSVFNRRNDN